MRIEGRTRNVPPQYEEVYRRAVLGFGKLITREDIERSYSPDTKSYLSKSPEC